MAVRRTWQISLLTLSLFTLVVQSATSAGEKESNNTGPWRRLPATNYCDPVEQCPVTSSRKEWRKLCIGWVKEDEFDGLAYHCQINSDHNVSLEFLYPRFKCPKGTYGLVEYNDKTSSVRIFCETCGDDYFQTEAHYSPENLKGCTYPRRSHDPMKVKCDPTPGPSEPQRCYCNYLDNWFSKSRQLFCGFTHYCDCINTVRCDTHNEDLLPDGRCYSRCEGVRRSDRHFDCIITETQGNVNSKIAQVVTTTPLEQDVDSIPERTFGKEYQTTHRTHRQATSSDGEHTVIKIVLPLTVIMAIFVIIVISVIYFRTRRSSITSHTNIKKASGNLYNIKHADSVKVSVKYGSGSSASDVSLTEESTVSEEEKEVTILLSNGSGTGEIHIPKKS